MLIKTTDRVFVPAVSALPYRQSSRTCPPPVPPTSGGTKRVCGTLTKSVFLAFNDSNKPINVTKTLISIEGLHDVVSYSPNWNRNLPTSLLSQISSVSYCTTVRT